MTRRLNAYAPTQTVNGWMVAGTPRPRVGLILAGTGNSLATDLECFDSGQAAHAIIGGWTRPLDVMEARLGSADDRGAAAAAAGDDSALPRTLYAFNIVG